jgi:hypothetical protein
MFIFNILINWRNYISLKITQLNQAKSFFVNRHNPDYYTVDFVDNILDFQEQHP